LNGTLQTSYGLLPSEQMSGGLKSKNIKKYQMSLFQFLYKRF
jgi:hypothetical protein